MDTSAKRAFIHIGYPKCASTYLQHEVFPAMGNFIDLTKQPHETKWMLLSNEKPLAFRDKIFELLEKEKNKNNYLIISYEGFAPKLFDTFADLFWNTRRMDVSKYRNPKQPVAEKIAQAFPDASIIIIIREQIAWAISQYKMYWRRGHTDQQIDDLIDRHQEGYDKVIEQYQKLFGAQNVRVVPYELLRSDPAAFVHAVTGFIDPNYKPIISNKRVNYAPALAKDVCIQRNKRIYKQKIKNKAKTNSIFYPIFMKLVWCVANVLAIPYYVLKHGKEISKVRVSQARLDAVMPGIAKSNQRIEKLTGLNLRQFGYYLGEETDRNSMNQ